MPLEERLYRHRCVEAWSMAVPWTGFPLEGAGRARRPLGGARYSGWTTFGSRDGARASARSGIPGPMSKA